MFRGSHATFERAEAAEHGGHLTKGEQRQLNREENGVSRQIYDEKHPDAPQK